MKRTLLYTLLYIGIGSTLAGWSSRSYTPDYTVDDSFDKDRDNAIENDTLPQRDRTDDFINNRLRNPYDLNDPSIIEKEVEFDPETNQYIIKEKIGKDYYRAPTYMSFEEYLEYRAEQQQREYFARMGGIGGPAGGLKKDPLDKIDVSRSLVDRLFGGSNVDINPQGNIDVTLGVNHQRRENPVLLARQQNFTNLNFDMAINMSVTGQIGEKLKLNANYNTQATFDFDNQMRLEYDSEAFSEDEIIKKIEAGNVTLPLRSNLIQGAQSLFGIKTEMQFGKLRLTAIASQQRSESQNIQVQGGAQQQFFEVKADEYDENRHFFISHFNRETFEPALDNLPIINSVFKINRIDVYVTNERNQAEGVRDIVALADMGEFTRLTNPNVRPGPGANTRDVTGQYPLPANDVNTLYSDILDRPETRTIDNAVNVLQRPPFNMEMAKDFEKVRARKLLPSEYTVNLELGYISLNTTLRPDQVLGVAYEYVYNGEVFQVGEFDNEVPNAQGEDLGVLFVRMLKSTTPRVDIPNWHLMMKNIYNINAYQVNQEDFRLDIVYEDPGGGEKRFLPSSNLAGVPLIRVFNLDNLNMNGDPGPDGVFDFVEGLTINTRNGRIMFPVLEPFGSSLSNQIDDAIQRERYTYQMLYDSTVTRAREYPELNRYTIRGSYKSSVTSEISLGAFNIPEGSVRVTAGAMPLVEGVDYEIDYSLGRVRILNDALLGPGNQVNVSFENNAMFSFQQKTMIGLRAEYEVNRNLQVGGTYMHLFERPFTQKVNLGDDPINNRIYGLDFNYSDDAPWLTRIVDMLPFYSTKEMSRISVSAEAAALRPGYSRAIKQNGDGAVYLDDFEGTISRIDMRTPANAWVLSSVPQFARIEGRKVFEESELINDRLGGVNRALLNWYRIDNIARTQDDSQNPYTRPVNLQEIFRNASIQPGLNNVVQIFDMTYHPQLRGPYNYDVPGGTRYSAGLDINTGNLLEPETRFGGIMRALTTNDFEAANVEYIEFWMLSPFMDKPDGSPITGPGKIVFNLGNISEDILRDSRLFFENGMPTPGQENIRVDQTNWGRIPRVAQIVPAFDIDDANREAQDVGLDGMDDDLEREFLEDYLQALQNGGINPDVYQTILNDPANDNFLHFQDQSFPDGTSVIDRYLKWNNPEGNSRSPRELGLNINTAYTNIPDSEDINRDNTLNETESYYEYVIPVEPDGTGGIDRENNPYITDQIEVRQGEFWYRFKVPVMQFTRAVNGINDFRSIRFIRMYMTEFDQTATFRFARFELIRNQWRRYLRSLREPGVIIDGSGADDVFFDLAAVNFDENSGKLPFNYVIPPGIQREQAIGAFPDVFQNEQSLALTVCNLTKDNAQAAYRLLNYDMRLFDRVKMFVHAEEADHQNDPIPPGEVSIFIRFGSDFTNNYYEYEVPLTMSDPAQGIRNAANIWLKENEMDFSLDLFRDLKVERNTLNIPLTQLYQTVDPDKPQNNVKVIGNPNLGLVRGIMIGVKNIGDPTTPRCFEVWANELRVTGFDEEGGVAAQATVNLELADLGNMSLSGNYSTIGFGGLEQRIQERSREQMFDYDWTTNLQLGRFFSEQSGVQMPFFAQYSNAIRTPQFDPYDLDIELRDKLNAAPDRGTRDSLRRQAIDRQVTRTYSFNNVRIESSKEKIMPWNISNFNFNYAYAQVERSDPFIEFDRTTQNRGSIDYSYSRRGGFITPFKNLIKKDKYFKFITDFNFNPLPNSFTMINTFDRIYQERVFRFTDPELNFWVNKQFLWDRDYNLQWDFTKSLKLVFNAMNNSIIDELPEIDRDGFQNEDFSRQANREFILNNIATFGRSRNYMHTANLSYTVPMKNFPLLDFVNIRANVNTSFAWNRAALEQEFLGNVIQNSQNRSVNADLNFDRLYGKWKYLQKIERAGRGGGGARPGAARGRAMEQFGKQVDPNKADEKPGGRKKDEEKSGPSIIEQILVRPLLSIRKLRVNVSQNTNSIVPGFDPTPNLMGLSQNWSAPGWQYVSGFSPTDRDLDNFAANGWIVDTFLLNQQVMRGFSENLDARLTLEPFRDFKIDIDASRTRMINNTVFLKNTEPDGGEVRRLQSRDIGSYTVSFMALNTLFGNDFNDMFRDFERSRERISQRVAVEKYGLPPGTVHDEDGDEFAEGLGRFQTDVLVPAFLATYAGIPLDEVKLDFERTIPRPNWNISYDGLAKIPMFANFLSSLRLSHAYNSTMSVNSFNTSAKFMEGELVVNEITSNYYSRFEIPTVIINEAMNPLIGIDMKTKNDIRLRLDIRQNRNLAMSFIDYQLSETQTNEIILGFGYEIKNVVIGIFKPRNQRGNQGRRPGDRSAIGGQQGGRARQQAQSNNLRINFDFSIRDDLTVIHLLEQEQPAIPTRGMRTTRISPFVEYDVNQALTIRLFVDYSRSVPATTITFPITNINSGIRVRFALN